MFLLVGKHLFLYNLPICMVTQETINSAVSRMENTGNEIGFPADDFDLEALYEYLRDDFDSDVETELLEASTMRYLAAGFRWPTTAKEICYVHEGLEKHKENIDRVKQCSKRISEFVNTDLEGEIEWDYDVLLWADRILQQVGAAQDLGEDVRALISKELFHDNPEIAEQQWQDYQAPKGFENWTWAAGVVYYTSHLNHQSKRVNQSEISDALHITERSVRRAYKQVEAMVGTEITPNEYISAEVNKEVKKIAGAKDNISAEQWMDAAEVVRRYVGDGTTRGKEAVAAAAMNLCSDYSMRGCCQTLDVAESTVSDAKQAIQDEVDVEEVLQGDRLTDSE